MTYNVLSGTLNIYTILLPNYPSGPSTALLIILNLNLNPYDHIFLQGFVSSMYFFFYCYFFLGNTVLKLHTHFHSFYCISATIIVRHFLLLLDGVCLSGNNRITYLLT